MQVRIIISPVASGADGEWQSERLRKALESRGVMVDVVVTHAPGDAEAAARDPAGFLPASIRIEPEAVPVIAPDT